MDEYLLRNALLEGGQTDGFQLRSGAKLQDGKLVGLVGLLVKLIDFS